MINFNKKKIFLWGFSILFISISAFFLYSFEPEAKVNKKREKIWGVEAVKIKREAYQPEIQLFGELNASKYSNLRSLVKGSVKDVYVAEGDYVSKDQLLVMLDNEDARLLVMQKAAELQEAIANFGRVTVNLNFDRSVLDYTHKLYNRSKQDFLPIIKMEDKGGKGKPIKIIDFKSKKLISSSLYNIDIKKLGYLAAREKAKVDNANIMWQRALLEFEKSYIVAPYSGLVTNIHVSEGDFVDETLLLGIFDRNSIEISSQIPTRYSSIITNNKEAISGEINLNNDSYSLKLDRVMPSISNELSGITGFFKFDSLPDNVESNKLVKFIMKASAIDNSIALPITAIHKGDLVFLLNKKRLKSVKIEKLGYFSNSDDTRYIIVGASELDDGDLVMVTNLSSAISGVKVNVSSVLQPPVQN
jgi:biotin carboxyl carrier protein